MIEVVFYTQAVLPDSAGVSAMLLSKLFTGGGDSGAYSLVSLSLKLL